MDLLEIAVGLLEKGGAVAGLGGGYIATRVLSRINKGLDDAKHALTLAKQAAARAEEAYTLAESLKSALSYQAPYRGGTGGQLGEIDLSKLVERITQLETRMSAIEDDFDDQQKEEKKSWEAIFRAVGRLEGAIDRRDPNR
jgi:hypothetical protein